VVHFLVRLDLKRKFYFFEILSVLWACLRFFVFGPLVEKRFLCTTWTAGNHHDMYRYLPMLPIGCRGEQREPLFPRLPVKFNTLTPRWTCDYSELSPDTPEALRHYAAHPSYIPHYLFAGRTKCNCGLPIFSYLQPCS
jgi:hypothetical protein